MSLVLHFRKQLTSPPVAADAPGICVRQLIVPQDVPAWIALRDWAMARERPAVRPWTIADFHSELIGKPWWNAEHSWVATDGDASPLLGAVTLAIRAGQTGSVPVVHWLVVDPACRRRGVARLLMSRVEQAAWNDGWREVQLETHTGWSAAVAFYHSMGYAPVRDRSPR
jgi:GNAT superfamily N-acetyltransferase